MPPSMRGVRELLQSRSVPAPGFVEPVPPAAGHGRRLALVAGAVIAIGIGAALWPSGRSGAVETPDRGTRAIHGPRQSLCFRKAPAMASPATESTTEAHAAESGGPAEESTVVMRFKRNRPPLPPGRLSSGSHPAPNLKSSPPDMDPVSSTEGALNATEPTVVKRWPRATECAYR